MSYKVVENTMVYCPLMGKEIPDGYCYELCNIAEDYVLLEEDRGTIGDWDKAQDICAECGRYE